MPNEEIIGSKLQVDITDFKKGLSDANRYIRMANSEFENATAGLDKWSNSADGLRAKLTQLDKTLEGQEAALSVLRAEYERVVKEQGENSKGAQELAIKLNKQEAACKKTASQIDHYKGALNDMEQTADEAGDEAENLGDSLDDVADAAKKADKATENVGDGLSDTLGKAASAAGNLARNLAGIAGKAVVAGVKGIAAASAGLITAFLATGETSKEWIGNMNKLDAVAKSTGSSTEGMKRQFTEFYGILGDETAATTTASNLQAVGLSQKNLASVTNSMAGIWSKYGDSIPLDGLAESINETSKVGQITGNLADALNWAGISEDAFNEKLAACSSEAERQQLIVDALNGAYGKLGQTYKEQNAAVIESNKANAALQDALAGVGQASMPVMSALKLMGASVLKDLLPGIKDLGAAFSGVLGGDAGAAAKMGEAVSSMLQQLGQKIVKALPTIISVGGSILSSLVQGLIQAAPALGDAVSQLVQYLIKAAPQLLAAGASLVKSLAGAILSNAGDLLSAGGQLVFDLLSGIVSKLPSVLQSAVSLVGNFVNGLKNQMPIMLKQGAELLGKLGEGIRNGLPDLVSQGLDILMNFAETLYDAAPQMIETGFSLLSDLVQGILDALPTLIAKGPEIISKFANIINDNFPKILQKGVQLIGQIIKGLLQAIPTLIANIPKIITAIVDVWQAFNWLQLGKNAITFMKDGILKMVGAVKGAGTNILNTVTNAIRSLPSKLLELGKNSITSMKNGISSMISAVKSAGGNVLFAIVNAISALPGKLLTFGKNAISNLGSSIGNGVSSIASKAKNIVKSMLDAFINLPSEMTGIGKNIINGIINGIGAMVGKLYDSIKNALGGLVKKAKNALGIKSPSRVLADEVGKWIPAGVAEGITDNAKTANRAMVDMAKQAVGAANTELSGSSLKVPGVTGSGAAGGKTGTGGVTYVFNQYNNSPKALNRAEIYRQTKNQLRFATQS